MNRFTTAAIFLLILAASVFAAGGALKPVTATEFQSTLPVRGATLGVFVWVVDDENVYGPAGEAAAYADSDEAASVVYYLKLVRIA